MNKRIVEIGICCVLILLLIPFTILADMQGKNDINAPFTAGITILQPEKGILYVWSRPVVPLSFNRTIIVGPILIQVGITGYNGFEVDFYIDGEFKFRDSSWPFEYWWIDPTLGTYLITVEEATYEWKDSIKVFKIL